MQYSKLTAKELKDRCKEQDKHLKDLRLMNLDLIIKVHRLEDRNFFQRLKYLLTNK